jgi:omega-hydroxy-beta-dihydromenaquinone-9 sulfotransferase
MAEQSKQRREWSPRMWEGCDTPTLLKLLVEGHFAVTPKLAYIPAICSGMSYLNTFLKFAQHGIYGRKISATKITHPPLFVLGHWRTGTTLLHELFILDKNHSYPDTHACLLPHHILLSDWFFKRHLNFLMPEKRPMDNMAIGWERPQEDEFALALLGMPSPYRDICFPNQPSKALGSLDLSGLSDSQKATWKRTLLQFIKTLTFRDPRRLILKSPTHTARIPYLLDLFPDAKFVNIVRNPYTLFSSTINLWMSMSHKHGFQTPNQPDRIREKVLREFRILYERYLADRSRIPANRLVELRYEEFVADPMPAMKQIYEQLDLGDWVAARPGLDRYFAQNQKYETNKYSLSDSDRRLIDEHWGDLIPKIGYSRQST